MENPKKMSATLLLQGITGVNVGSNPDFRISVADQVRNKVERLRAQDSEMAHLCCDIVECALWRTWEIIEPNLEKSAYPLGMEQELRIGFEAFSKIFVTVTFKVEESSLTILDFHVDHDNGGSPTNPGGSTRGKKAKGIMIEMLGLQGLPAIRLKSNRDAKAEFQDKVIRPSSLICGVFIGRPWRGLHLPPPTKIREQVHAGPSGICYKSAFYFLNQSIR